MNGVAAPPPDVRKGSAFPGRYHLFAAAGGEASKGVERSAYGEAQPSPHIRRQSRKTGDVGILSSKETRIFSEL
jgi:hypothetical protein